MLKTAVEIKASLLSAGVRINNNVLENYGSPYIEKRRAYGNQDPERYKDTLIPQELLLGEERLVCAININDDSSWELAYDDGNKLFFVSDGRTRLSVDFPLRPEFYDSNFEVYGKKLNQVFTLYGGNSIGAFLLRNCAFNGEAGCHYCSLENNSGNHDDFVNEIDEKLLILALEEILKGECKFEQVMLNGGSWANQDTGFVRYVKTAFAAKAAIKSSGKSLDLHLITSPPTDISIVSELAGAGFQIAMNMEAYDERIYRKYCPGKSRVVTRDILIGSLKKSVEVLGPGQVYSILVGGLEPLESLVAGMNYLANLGVVPVVNVLHIDPGTKMADADRPTEEFILGAGYALQRIYHEFGFKPFYENCGRNSLDTEAYRGLF